MTKPKNPKKPVPKSEGQNSSEESATVDTTKIAAPERLSQSDGKKSPNNRFRDFEELLSLDRWLGDFLLTLGFFTRLPAPMDDETAKRPLAKAAWAFPIVGLVIGAFGGGVLAIGNNVGVPPLGAALLAVATMICISGALHEDGLADCADGLWSGADAPKRLAIMRDSRIGAFGVIALILFIGLKAVAIGKLATVGGSWSAVLAIIAAASLSRGLLPVAMVLMPLARDDGRAADAGTPTQQDAMIAAGLAALICLLCLGSSATVIAVLIGAGLATLFSHQAIKRVGGYTGDVLGASQQIIETATLLVASSVL
ncbi:MAG: adenosylcobinamide-GDP ribazoletransferase [Proteobacteria bacterium]|nr:adenosylcobinamide-GDP ribazoletransferase [Pseudomonadota bacterium]